jgi:hypothetical protein
MERWTRTDERAKQMSIGSAKQHVAEAGAAAVEVDVRGRWDALALSERLVPFHSFLVHLRPDHWVVHARSPGCHGEPLADALASIETWRTERDVEAAVRINRSPRSELR